MKTRFEPGDMIFMNLCLVSPSFQRLHTFLSTVRAPVRLPAEEIELHWTYNWLSGGKIIPDVTLMPPEVYFKFCSALSAYAQKETQV